MQTRVAQKAMTRLETSAMRYRNRFLMQFRRATLDRLPTSQTLKLPISVI